MTKPVAQLVSERFRFDNGLWQGAVPCVEWCNTPSRGSASQRFVVTTAIVGLSDPSGQGIAFAERVLATPAAADPAAVTAEELGCRGCRPN